MSEQETKKCPFCAEEIMAAASKCKHCGSMVDGSDTEKKVVVTGIAPFAEYTTPIQGKAKGKITVIGYLGVGLGAFILVLALVTLPMAKDDGLANFVLALVGIGAATASYLWARR